MPIHEHRKSYPRKPKLPKVPVPPPVTSHKFSYMLKPETVAELESRGIRFVTADIGEDHSEDRRFWPAFKLPSGRLIMLSADDEGNGPGSIMEAQS